MLNEVRLIGRVQHPIGAGAGPASGYSFTVWTGILIRVSVSREIGPRLKAALMRRTSVFVEGELCRGGSVWARRVIILTDAKPRHIGLALQDKPRIAEAALASEFPLPDRPRGQTIDEALPGASLGFLCPFHGERCPGPPVCAGS